MKSKGFIMDFWNGDVKLWKSFWLMRTLAAFVYGVIIATAWAVMNPYVEFPILLALILIVPVDVFMIIGTWRSSDKYKGPKFWAVLTKIVLVLGIITTLFNLFS